MKKRFEMWLKKWGFMREEGIFYIGGPDVLPPPLKGEEEQQALDAMEQGCESAKQRLIERNSSLPWASKATMERG